jgi:hypothetical protein
VNDKEHLIESKTTTQHAPLELFLTYLRSRKILPYVKNATVLDFGCGAHLRTLQAIGGRASHRFGLDSYYKKGTPHRTSDGIVVVGSFADLRSALDQNGQSINMILSLACFEHFKSSILRGILAELSLISTDDAVLLGTVPTPWAKPILEFLSYKLRLIDRSQIEDHEVYYSKAMLENTLLGSGWELDFYKPFQFGMNSFFRLKKTNTTTIKVL